jgi:hypothetical protein
MALLLGGAGQAWASIGILYDNGPINGNISAWTISNGYIVSDSFTSFGPTNLTGAQAGLWVDGGATALTVDWSIGTTPYGSDISSGVSTPLNNTLVAPGRYDIYESAFSLSGSLPSTGTYYLTLQNATATDSDIGGAVYWDINDGPSAAYDNAYLNYPDNSNPFGNVNDIYFLPPGTNSDSFQVFGTVPEPTTFIVWSLLGGVGVAVGCWRRRKAA